MLFTSEELLLLIEHWMWPFFRIGGMLMTMPIIGTRSIPVRIRMMTAIAVTWVVAPIIPVNVYIDPLSMDGILVSINQTLIGITLGLTVRIIFVVLEIAGQAVGQLMGLMMASMVDPQNGNQVPIIGQMYLMFATLMFVSMNGHLIMIQNLAESFFLMPVSTTAFHFDMFWQIIDWSSIILSTGVLISLPVLVSMLVVNIAFGVMTRAAPQLNIFAVGFPVMMILGVMILMFSLDGFVPQVERMFNSALDMMLTVINN